MTAIALPAPSRWAQVTAKIIPGGDASQQVSPLDGTSQVVLRMGDRFAVDVVLPAQTESIAAPWLGAWEESQATGSTLQMQWPQPPLCVPIGTPLVNGANQTGTTLIVDGLPANVLLTAMRAFSFSDGSRHYLHRLTRDVVANGSGQATLHIAPMLRAKPADNAPLEFVTPVIEGLMTAAPTWGFARRRYYAVSFTLQENG